MKILGHDYALRLAPPLERGGIDQAGRCHSGHQLILISTEQHKQAQESTLIHEIIEALDYHLELKLEHNVIASLESGLYQVLTQNGVKLSPLMRGAEKMVKVPKGV